MEVIMKKLLLIAACAGLFLGLQTQVKATATQGTLVSGQVAVVALAVGAVAQLVGTVGPTNVLNGAIAGGAGLGVWSMANIFIRTPLAQKLAWTCIASNPAVTAIGTGLAVGCIALAAFYPNGFTLARNDLAKSIGTKLIKAGALLATGTAISYCANTVGYNICPPFEKLPELSIK
jgi:hypothetical protein